MALRVSQLHQEAAREKLRVATNKYAQEAVLYKDVLQTQAGLADASNRYQQALLAFWTARADFEKAIGEI
jgi:outer membrane protein TolC